MYNIHVKCLIKHCIKGNNHSIFHFSNELIPFDWTVVTLYYKIKCLNNYILHIYISNMYCHYFNPLCINTRSVWYMIIGLELCQFLVHSRNWCKSIVPINYLSLHYNSKWIKKTKVRLISIQWVSSTSDWFKVRFYAEILDLNIRSIWPTYAFSKSVHYLCVLEKWVLFTITSDWKRQVFWQS